MADMNGLQGLIPSASPIASSGVDWEEMLASGDPSGYLAAHQSGVPFPLPTAARPAVAPPSPLAAVAGKPQAAVAPTSTPAPATGTATSQPAAQDSKPYGMTLDGKSPMEGFGQSLAAGAQAQMPATNAPTTDKTGATAVPGTVTPTGTPDDPNQAGIQRAGTMAENFARKLQDQPTLAETLAPIQKQRTLPPQEYDPSHPEYKPSAGRRFLRGLQAVGMGVAEHGIAGGLLGGLDPAAVGATPYSAPTRAFSIAAQKQAAQQGSLDQQAATAEKAFTADTGRAKDIITSINDIGKNYAAGETAQSRTDVAQARKESADAQMQIADVKQQLADQAAGKLPTTEVGLLTAQVMEPAGTPRRAALDKAVDEYRMLELARIRAAAPTSQFAQPLVDDATAKVKELNDAYEWDPSEFKFYSIKNSHDNMTAQEFTDKKNKIVADVNKQLVAKKLPTLPYPMFTVEATTPGGQAPAAAPATQPAAKSTTSTAKPVEAKSAIEAQPGQTYKGFTYTGGERTDKANWKPVAK